MNLCPFIFMNIWVSNRLPLLSCYHQPLLMQMTASQLSLVQCQRLPRSTDTLYIGSSYPIRDLPFILFVRCLRASSLFVPSTCRPPFLLKVLLPCFVGIDDFYSFNSAALFCTSLSFFRSFSERDIILLCIAHFFKRKWLVLEINNHLASYLFRSGYRQAPRKAFSFIRIFNYPDIRGWTFPSSKVSVVVPSSWSISVLGTDFFVRYPFPFSSFFFLPWHF